MNNLDAQEIINYIAALVNPTNLLFIEGLVYSTE